VNGPAHIFYEAKESGADLVLHFVSFDGSTEVNSSAGLYFSRLESFHEFELNKDDFIFIPGLDFKLLSDQKFLQQNIDFFTWLKAQNSNSVNICSVCTGAFLLAESGILRNKQCTTHWKFLTQFEKRYPNIDLLKNRLFVADDNLLTSAGVSSGLDLSLFILEKIYGTKFATDIAKEVVIYFRRSDSDPQLSIYLEYRNHIEDRIHKVQDFIIQNIHTDFTLNSVGDEVYMSSRNLTRLFKKVTGITIGTYVDKLRVERALQLLAENNKIDFVASKCGLKSTNQLRSLLKKHKDLIQDSKSID